jgi:hypothetical protein
MNKALLRAASAACLLAGLAGTMGAQLGHPAVLRSEVPFAFVWRGHTLPAGQYSIEIGEKWVRFTDSNGYPVQAGVPNSRDASRTTQPRLEFCQSGDRYFLWQIRTGDYGIGFRIPRDERTLEPRQSVVTTALR